ncbi:hypothetical protein [Phormidium nigroviride]
MAPETGFLRESVGKNEVFSSKNPVYEVGCVSPVMANYQPSPSPPLPLSSASLLLRSPSSPSP